MLYPDNLPPERLAIHASDNMLLFTAVLAIFIGIVLIGLGLHGKQMWMVVWSFGLIICSVLMGSAVYFQL